MSKNEGINVKQSNIEEETSRFKIKPAGTGKDEESRESGITELPLEPRRRAFPIWLRLVAIVFFSAFALVAGAMIGYGIVGDGNVFDVFKVGTWQHIVDIINKGT
ncbi:DNA-directed RNA polymerase subunit beta [Scopulibacillus darangshiensis]|uniref:DNA-directed RNA polymerase subunit beta n=1 Tax=Scopulibacillus darangshiensis TaxID=442528 RepID=A0A4R2NEN8_9BACL|nr:DNA-directed RNA polymerase subunit beta [Scopulibacillus darangshiensis]TCP19524.1 DNA-directed RNA polymerase subunit beta [Scopulibacillus darangshiensis]